MSEKNGSSFPYSDLIDLPHHVSRKHPPLSREQRAAQFAPFAALTGFGDAIGEAGRLTKSRTELSDDSKDELDRRLSFIAQCGAQPEISVRYFLKDEYKEGGAYVSASGRFRRTDIKRRMLVLADGTEIPLGDIYAIESDVFPDFGQE